MLKALTAAALASGLVGIGGAAAPAEEFCAGDVCACDCGEFACFVRSWGSLSFAFPNGVGVAADGTLYVAEFPHRILHYDAAGTRLGEWGSEGSGPGEFNSPTGVAVGPDDLIYVVDAGNHRIQVFTEDGAFQQEWGRHGDGDGQFNAPLALAVAADGTVYVADTDNRRVQFFAPTGDYLGQWGGQGRKAGRFDFPLGIAVAGDGTVYVSDEVNNRVQFFAPDGRYLGQWATVGSSLFAGPTSLAVAPDGKAVYVTRGHDHRLLIYGLDPAPIAWGSEGQGPGEFKNPDGVAVAPDGTLYVLDASNHRVQAFSACITI